VTIIVGQSILPLAVFTVAFTVVIGQ